MSKNLWLFVWRFLLLGELVGMMTSGLIAAFSWQTLHVTMIALWHQPNLLLDAGTVFVTASIASLVLLVAFVFTTPVLLLLEFFAMRSRRVKLVQPVGIRERTADVMRDGGFGGR